MDRRVISEFGHGPRCERANGRQGPGHQCPGRLLLLGTGLALGILILASWLATAAHAQDRPILAERIEGLLVGTLIGDALATPHETAPAPRSRWTSSEGVLTAEGRKALAATVRLGASSRPADPFGPWSDGGPAGTLSDDSRWKVLFFRSLETAGRPNREAFARALLAWFADSSGMHGRLPARWLREPSRAARKVTGWSDPRFVTDPERLWGGRPTTAGLMAFLPIAAIAARRPEEAYRLTGDINFLDHGEAADLSASLIAGIAAAMQDDADLASVERVMRELPGISAGTSRGAPPGTAPGTSSGYARPTVQWLDFAHDAARRAGSSPAKLYRILDAELGVETGREAWLPIALTWSCALVADGDPLATLRLILEYGPGATTTLPVAAALFGAMHGSRIFAPVDRAAVSRTLREEYGAGLGPWMVAIDRARAR